MRQKAKLLLNAINKRGIMSVMPTQTNMDNVTTTINNNRRPLSNKPTHRTTTRKHTINYVRRGKYNGNTITITSIRNSTTPNPFHERLRRRPIRTLNILYTRIRPNKLNYRFNTTRHTKDSLSLRGGLPFFFLAPLCQFTTKRKDTIFFCNIFCLSTFY